MYQRRQTWVHFLCWTDYRPIYEQFRQSIRLNSAFHGVLVCQCMYQNYEHPHPTHVFVTVSDFICYTYCTIFSIFRLTLCKALCACFLKSRHLENVYVAAAAADDDGDFHYYIGFINESRWWWWMVIFLIILVLPTRMPDGPQHTRGGDTLIQKKRKKMKPLNNKRRKISVLCLYSFLSQAEMTPWGSHTRRWFPSPLSPPFDDFQVWNCRGIRCCINNDVCHAQHASLLIRSRCCLIWHKLESCIEPSGPVWVLL